MPCLQIGLISAEILQYVLESRIFHITDCRDNINQIGLISAEILLLVYANYLDRTSQSASCGGVTILPKSLRQQAKRQVDYILGDNPKGMSYIVGCGSRYPQRIHHRGSSVPSIRDHPDKIACKYGSVYYDSWNQNPNILVRALVGGPGEDDSFKDDRADFRESEPTTYINTPFVGVLAYFAANPN